MIYLWGLVMRFCFFILTLGIQSSVFGGASARWGEEIVKCQVVLGRSRAAYNKMNEPRQKNIMRFHITEPGDFSKEDGVILFKCQQLRGKDGNPLYLIFTGNRGVYLQLDVLHKDPDFSLSINSANNAPGASIAIIGPRAIKEA
jgi:hypothetical protein